LDEDEPEYPLLLELPELFDELEVPPLLFVEDDPEKLRLFEEEDDPEYPLLLEVDLDPELLKPLALDLASTILNCENTKINASNREKIFCLTS
jgi:hypothetical protein